MLAFTFRLPPHHRRGGFRATNLARSVKSSNTDRRSLGFDGRKEQEALESRFQRTCACRGHRITRMLAEFWSRPRFCELYNS